MKAPIAIALAGCCVFGSILALAADEENSSKPSELETLRKRVADLEARVLVLEGRFHLVPRDPNAAIPRRWLHGRPVPENWSRREFNGMPYYVIPLRHDPNERP
ncbi:MAG: hypothetical protein ACYTAS_09650 [Planctomycetota bacterium]|jgi:hypothetical protein